MVREFLVAGSAAIGAITCTHPIDVVKTRLQFQGELGSGNKKIYNGVVRSLILIGRNEGLKGLYRGISYSYMVQFATTGTRFATYDFLKQLVINYNIKHNPTGNPTSNACTPVQLLGLSTIAGLCGATIGNPLFRLKTEMQVFSTAKHMVVGTQHAPDASIPKALYNIYKHEGILGYWKGYSAFALRVMAYSSMQLSCYDVTKRFLISKGLKKENVTTHLSASVIAATAGVTFMQPFDFITSRLMNQKTVGKGQGNAGVLYSGALDCIKKSVQAEGISCLFKGYIANCARMGPYCVLTFLFYEQLSMTTRKFL